MIRIIDVYKNIGIENVYREELWLIRFEEKSGDPLEANFFDTDLRLSGYPQRSGAIKLIASSQDRIFPTLPAAQ